MIIDYDIGFDWDDTATHLLAMASPELDVQLFITNDEYRTMRAQFSQQMVRLSGNDVPVVAGTDLGNNNFVIEDLVDHGQAVDIDWERAILRCLEANEAVVYLGLGSMTNIARFVDAHPAESRKLSLVQMGGALCDLYRHGRERPEHNVALDPAAFLAVLRSDVSTRLVMAHTTVRQEIEINADAPLLARMRESEKAETRLAAVCFDRWYQARGHGSYLHDPLTCSVLIEPGLVDFVDGQLIVDHDGFIQLAPESRIQLREKLHVDLDDEDGLRSRLDGEKFDVRVSAGAAYAEFLDLMGERIAP